MMKSSLKIKFTIVIYSTLLLVVGYYLGCLSKTIPDPEKIEVVIGIESEKAVDWSKLENDDFSFTCTTFHEDLAKKILHGPTVIWNPVIKSKKITIYNFGKRVSTKNIDILN